ncbi:glucose/quinate/shikimate family membrane-bound PQQ-dependent dehydrogenase [Bradyrhizobium sp. U87765 SZCCT0131]|uniref:glucose/quinate/shikimate family membrane-bound PQQ-dependent dehydrogenase n=1 Tax=unclassified Bradyrhizobium TaxID=2631580 RepID=UPI001BA8CE8D|nr:MULTISPECIES: glucose/quinate/shikimate family membrane-bound PQQ-dependent dehydrogenase [unclassified Bradyrhizobium]MBR1219172.1 glucose/quinate/shikimate family membrane-bound PQQ-dependent dehydrogenase [Bradyrhizobium sp. U87765 SZCCT0131]MBR1261823.1 glucose/quinate/shikimate family membrane-bound PQQ-dependent dehydrogenase [Bradyrhizobium sp. U87765 SZCCT0134]MBR1306324.1 glucose/quinate/shikimate family membrane-bound PQQ-dependent dehydrogenase [Bradyrhizobium sp. U87765 SZCCT0110]
MQSTNGRSRVVLVTGLVCAVLGLALAGGGVWLAALGGSRYYVLAGAGVIVTGALLIAHHRAALWVYAAVLIGTLVWAVGEVRFDWWPLAARGDLLFPLALWLLTPWVAGRLTRGGGVLARAPTLPLWAGVAASVAVLAVGLAFNLGIGGAPYHERIGDLAAAVAAKPAAPQGEGSQPDADWRAYGRGQDGLRYSPLRQITPQNVSQLKVAWTFRTGDLPGPNDPVETTFEVTPIKVGDTLYLCTQHQKVFALDAATGKPRWTFDPQLKDNPTFQHLTCRGVSYAQTSPGATDSEGKPAPAECPRRIFLPVNDGRLIALDADTGKPCEGFADHGTLDLQQGMGIKTSGFYEPTSPPVIGERIVVVNGAVIDNYSTEEPSGVIRGFDLYTGRLVWAWDSGAAEENALPSPTHTYTNNSPNSWITASYDPKLKLVYMPMGVRTPDIWGGNRDALSERYASALVALDIDTGKRVWSYQTVHHDLWDMDLPAQPSLIDWPGEGGATTPAIVIPAKTGNLFVLDRRTGTPIVPAPERAVPQGAAPGDHVAPTQPFSELTLRPEELLTGADMWGATILDQLACRIVFHRLRYEGTFTPPSLQGTLVFPGNLGIFEWGGLAVDPERAIAIANPINIPFVSKLMPRGPDNPPAPTDKHPPGSEVGVQPMYGAPYGVDLHAFLSPIGLPCLRPPWGYIAGIDLRSRKVVWLHRNGTIRDSAPLPIPIRMGVPSLGGPIATAGGVAFFTGTADHFIRAYNVNDGHQLWEDRLPAGAQSTPMTYAVGERQFVVTAAGGHGSFGTPPGDYIIAYALAK